MKRYRIAQFGIYDLPSLGDTMFARVLPLEMGKYFPAGNIEVDLYSPNAMEHPYNKLPPVHGIDELVSRHVQCPYDAFILGGGEFIHYRPLAYNTLSGEQKKYLNGEIWRLPIRLAFDLGVPVYWSCLGAAYDFDADQSMELRKLCSRLEHIAMRDVFSAQRVLHAGVNKPVYHVPDMLWLLRDHFPKANLKKIHSKMAEVETCLQKPYFVLQYGTSYQYEEVARQALAIYRQKGWTPLLMVVNYCHEDGLVVQKIRQLDEAFCTIDRVLQPEEIMAVIQGAKLFLGTSLHGNVTSMLYGVPSLVLDMYPNTVSKMDGVLQDVQRNQWSCAEPGQISAMAMALLDTEQIQAVDKQVEEMIGQVRRYVANLTQQIQNGCAAWGASEALGKLTVKSCIDTTDYAQTALAQKDDDGHIRFVFENLPAVACGREIRWTLCTNAPLQIIGLEFRSGGQIVHARGEGDVVCLEDGCYLNGRAAFTTTLHARDLTVEYTEQTIALEGYVEKLCQVHKNQAGHIEQLLQSERDNLAKIAALEQALMDTNCRSANQTGHIEQLLQSERDNLAEIAALKRRLNEMGHMSIKRRILNRVLPVGSRKRFIVKMAYKSLGHPVIVMRKLSWQRIKKLLRAIKSGDLTYLQDRVTLFVDGPSLQGMPLELIGDTKEAYTAFALAKAENPLVSIIIPAYNQFDYTYKCIKSIQLHSGDVSYEVILADDSSTDQTKEIAQLIDGLRVVRTKKNLRFLLNCNHAAKQARGEYILYLNNDTQVQPGWLEPLVRLLEHDQTIGMTGSKLVYPDGRLQEAGGILWKDGSAWNYGHGQNPALPQFNYVKDVDYISGASILIRASLWKSLGGFDEHFAPAYCEDSDLAFAVRKAGYRVVYQPQSVVVHFEGVSNGTDTSTGLKAYQIENAKKLSIKWKDEFARQNDNAVDVFHARDCSIGKKTVLFVDHYVPMFDKDAGSRTVYGYIKLFVHSGYNVKFIGDNFCQHEPYTTDLQQMGVEVLYGSWYAAHWKEWVAENGSYIDYAFLNRPHIAPNYIDVLRSKTKAKIIYYGHDLHFLRMRREFELTHEEQLINDSNVWRERELTLMRKADMSYYPSEVEVKEIHKIDNSIRVKAIPAYLFESVSSVDYRIEERKDLFFIGGFNHGPNVDAVKWLANDILPLLLRKLPEIVVHIAGSNMPEEFERLANDHLIMEGRISDEELETFYRKIRICIVPLRYGAGIKGKVVESMAQGLPVVTTSCGAEGILNAEEILTCADTPQEIVACIAELYDDEAKLQSISNKGLDYVRKHFSEENARNVLRAEFGFE